MRYLNILLLIPFIISASEAQTIDIAPDLISIKGTGGFSCGQFIEHNKQNNPAQMDLYVQWVDGYLAAYNMRGDFVAQVTQYKRLPKIEPPDAPTVLLFLDTYCHNHPTDNVLRGTLSLIKELRGPVLK